MPETIYRAPATPFVARFTGVAGELRGRVDGPPDAAGRFRVETAGGPVLASPVLASPVLASRARPEPLAPAVTVLIRREAARLDSAGLPGRVEDIAYRGHGYDHLVELADGTRLAGVFASARRQRGEAVRVGLDPDGCFAYPATSSDVVPVR